jgi:septal ring factor EnvC (AmiA/AmiB activator)
MKNFLQNLLIFFSFCLCALIAFQWVVETRLRKDLQQKADTIHDKLEAIQNLQSTVKQDHNEIERLDGIKNDLTSTVKSNKLEITKITKDLEKTDAEREKNARQAEVYKEALTAANESITKQNEEVKKQNEDLKKLAEDRNAMVKKLNQMIVQYNDLVSNWNNAQEMLQKMSTNAAAAKK